MQLVPPAAGSALALELHHVDGSHGIGEPGHDSLLYVVSGSGALEPGGGARELSAGSAALVLAGEEVAVSGRLELLQATVAPTVDVHAALGERAHIARPDRGRAQDAVGARGFEVLFGPHNGSRRATLFLGYVPPGKAGWHYHLYDEIVFIPAGPGRLHRRDAPAEELTGGSAFRLRPREVHIVENASADVELTLLGVFTPAGSPSAAYLPDEAS